MQRLARTFALPWLLLAILLQADAVVKSTVMTLVADAPATAAMSALGIPCPMHMSGMAPMATGPSRASTGHARTDPKPLRHDRCPYCAAAAHVPILTSSAPLPLSCAVAFTGFRMAAVHGPRGPPAVRPRARDPPPVLA